MAERYVKLPNGSYLEWPQNVPADEFKAKALKVMGNQPKPDTAVDKMFPHGGEMSIGAVHEKPGLAGIEDQLGQLRTRLSQFAQKGVGQEVGDAMESPLLGLMKMMQGATENLRGHPWEGIKKGVSGMAESGKLYGAILPEAPIGKILPSTERAGQIFGELEKIAGKIPVDVNAPGKVASDIWDLTHSGGTTPKVINDFFRRATNPKAPPMTYSEMRKFYQNATRLSVDETNRLTPAVKRMIGEFTQKLGDSLWSAANSVGKGPMFNDAMRGYHRGAQFERGVDWAKKAALTGAAGATGVAAYKHYVHP